MKKVLFGMMTIAIASSTVFLACKKEVSTPNVTSNDFTELDKLSEKFLVNHKNSDISKLARLPKWISIVGADLKGALSGAATGAALGSAIPGMGTATGAAIGAVAGGASASIEKADTRGVVSHLPSYTPTGNPSNPEDLAGLQHYQCINAAALNESNYSSGGKYDNSRFYVFAGDFLQSAEFFPADWSQAFTLSSSNSNLDLVITNSGLSNGEFASKLYDEGKISIDVKNALVPYFACLDATTSVEDFVTYSIDAETIIASSHSLSTLDKKIILILMATARNGIEYWSEF